jgi:hypothetical protein
VFEISGFLRRRMARINRSAPAGPTVFTSTMIFFFYREVQP